MEFDIESLPENERTHVPFVVLLIKQLQAWKDSHGGNPPKTTPEKNEFKLILKDLIKVHENSGIDAHRNHFLAFKTNKIPFEIQEILNDPRAKDPWTEFWALVAALKNFISIEPNTVPVSGKVIDMTATTQFYIELQRIYKQKAEEDREVFKNLYKNVLA